MQKTVDVVRPGGVIALITSRYTLDKQDSSVRDYLADRAELLGAIRLPNTAFRENAGTSVTTDILFLQKRGQERPHVGVDWRALGAFQTAQGTIEINEFFIQHPEMMLGRMQLEVGQYGASVPTLVGDLPPDALSEAVARLPHDVYRLREQTRRSHSLTSDQVPDAGNVKEGAFVERDGQIAIRRGAEFHVMHLSDSVTARIGGMLQIRDAVRDVFQSQLADQSEETVRLARLHLNRVYDSFVARHGALNSKANANAFSEDPDAPLLLSLEDVDPDSGRAVKTAIFERPTLERYRPVDRVETASEALLVSLNETGRIDWPRMEALTSQNAEDLQDELGSLVYRNPEGGVWETADLYLSGNVRAKLAAAASAATVDPAYERNADALRSVQPPDLQPGDIEARLGSS